MLSKYLLLVNNRGVKPESMSYWWEPDSMESMVLEPESIKDLVEITGSCHQKLRWSRSLTEFLSQTSNGQGNNVFINHNQQKL